MRIFWVAYHLAFVAAGTAALGVFAQQRCLGTRRGASTVCDVGDVVTQLQIYTIAAVAVFAAHVYGIYTVVPKGDGEPRIGADARLAGRWQWIGPLGWALVFLGILTIPAMPHVGARWNVAARYAVIIFSPPCLLLLAGDYLLSFYVSAIYASPSKVVPTQRVYMWFIVPLEILLVVLDTATGLAIINGASVGAGSDLSQTAGVVLVVLKIAFVDLGLHIWPLAGLAACMGRKTTPIVRRISYYLSPARGITRASVSVFLFRRYLLADGNRSITDPIAIVLLVDMVCNLGVGCFSLVVRSRMASFVWDELVGKTL